MRELIERIVLKSFPAHLKKKMADDNRTLKNNKGRIIKRLTSPSVGMSKKEAESYFDSVLHPKTQLSIQQRADAFRFIKEGVEFDGEVLDEIRQRAPATHGTVDVRIVPLRGKWKVFVRFDGNLVESDEATSFMKTLKKASLHAADAVDMGYTGDLP